MDKKQKEIKKEKQDIFKNINKDLKNLKTLHKLSLAYKDHDMLLFQKKVMDHVGEAKFNAILRSYKNEKDTDKKRVA